MTVSGQTMQSGISPSLPLDEGLFWKNSMNAIFTERSIQPVLGNTLVVGGQGQKPSALLTNRINKTPHVIMGAGNSLVTWSELSGAVERAPGGLQGGDWWLESWGNHVVATNGVDPVLYWPAAGSFAPFGVPYRAAIAVHRNPFLVLFNTSMGENHIAWCDEDDIFTWNTAPNNLAGDLTIRDMDSEIIAALPMGDEIVFYGADSVHALTFRGAPYVFGAHKLYEGVGPVGKHAVCEVGRVHYGFGQKGIFQASTGDYRLISKELIHDYIYDDLSECPETLSRTVAYHDEIEELVLFFYPSREADCNNRCVAYNYRNNSWSPLNIRREAAVNVSAFPFGITADAFGNIFFQQTKNTLTNQNITGVNLAAKGMVETGFGFGEFGVIPFGGSITNACAFRCLQPNGSASVSRVIGNKSTSLAVLASPGENIWVESADFDLNHDGEKRVDTIRMFVEEAGKTSAESDIRVYVAIRNSLCEDLIWNGPYNAVNCVDKCLNLEGVFIRLRVEATQPLHRWKLSKLVLNGEIISEEAQECPNKTSTNNLSQSLRERAKAAQGAGHMTSCGGLKTIPEATALKGLKL